MERRGSYLVCGVSQWRLLWALQAQCRCWLILGPTGCCSCLRSHSSLMGHFGSRSARCQGSTPPTSCHPLTSRTSNSVTGLRPWEGRGNSTHAWEFPGSENMLCIIYGPNPELLPRNSRCRLELVRLVSPTHLSLAHFPVCPHLISAHALSLGSTLTTSF